MMLLQRLPVNGKSEVDNREGGNLKMMAVLESQRAGKIFPVPPGIFPELEKISELYQGVRPAGSHTPLGSFSN